MDGLGLILTFWIRGTRNLHVRIRRLGAARDMPGRARPAMDGFERAADAMEGGGACTGPHPSILMMFDPPRGVHGPPSININDV